VDRAFGGVVASEWAVFRVVVRLVGGVGYAVLVGAGSEERGFDVGGCGLVVWPALKCVASVVVVEPSSA
jgi:hypothetical protein